MVFGDRLKTRVVELFPIVDAEVQGATHEAKGFILSIHGPTDLCHGGVEKKMGWVMVGESLLSVGVIAPGVGADFLSTGICRARA